MAAPWEKYQATAPADGPWSKYGTQQILPTESRFIEDASPNPTEGNSLLDNTIIGVGKGMTDIIQGGKQALGIADEDDIAEKRRIDAPLMETVGGNVGNVVGQAALLAPTALIPGANTYAGAALIGAGAGALQPTLEDESTLTNAALGAAGGVVGQKVGNVISNRIRNNVTNAADLKSQNATRDATLKASQDAGYTVPRSLYDPTFMGNRLESVGGKAAIKQQAAAHNQQVTNALARKALGLPDDAPLSISAVEQVRTAAYKPYQEVAAISKQASTALEKLKQARADASGWFNAYNRSARPDDLAKAKKFQKTADDLEKKIDGFAFKSGQPGLLKELKEARKTIAKTYTIERAMNKGTGDIDAKVLGRLFDKGKPLSDGLDVAGRFSTAFPQVSQAGASIPAAGVSKMEALASAGMGMAGGAALGPAGLIAAGVPLLSHPARSLALSRMMQSTPQYGGLLLNSANKVSPSLPYIGTYGGSILGANSN